VCKSEDRTAIGLGAERTSDPESTLENIGLLVWLEIQKFAQRQAQAGANF
jgi:hypothetical protein